jgi:beta-glucosidase
MNKNLVLATLGVLFAGRLLAAETNTPVPYLDLNQPVDARVADLISRLTLEEKAALLNHVGRTVERFHIRADQWNQCLNGVQWDRPTTLFPACIAMSATWDTNLVHEIATALSDEARAIYNGWHIDPAAPGQHKGLIYRDPVINIGRNPYWGRNHEAWGEDPYLTGKMAVNYVQGLQGDDPRYLKIAATLKHFAVNNVESGRQGLNAVVPERILHEYWLPHFREAVVEGKASSLMASYNAINGVHNNINHRLLTDILKDDWHHEGFVVSDLGGVRSMMADNKMTVEDAVAQSLMAGCDFSDREFQDNIPAAVRDGKLTEARLNDSLTRVLRVRFRLGEFDPFDAVPFSKISTNVINDASHRALALKVGQESIVLLQNRGELLPLDKTKIKRIAVIGPLADRIVLNNYASSAKSMG